MERGSDGGRGGQAPRSFLTPEQRPRQHPHPEPEVAPHRVAGERTGPGHRASRRRRGALRQDPHNWPRRGSRARAYGNRRDGETARIYLDKIIVR